MIQCHARKNVQAVKFHDTYQCSGGHVLLSKITIPFGAKSRED